MTDEYTIHRVEAFEAFYRNNYRAVLRMVWALAGSSHSAEDITQEAFMSAQQRWSEVSQLDDPLMSVRRVALNRAASRHRRLAAEGRALLRLGPTAVELDEVPAESAHVWREVARLPSRQRQALVLSYVEGMSRSEVAELMGVGGETVKTHLDRARRKLADRLDNQ